MMSKNESLLDGSEEKKLSEIDQLVVYATHVQVHQRHMAINFIVNNLLVLCKHDIKKLFVVIDTLQKDQAISVRALLAEKLFEIGSYFSGHSKLGRYITSDLYDIIYKSLTDCSTQVRRACYESVFNLLNVNSIPHSLVEKTLLTVVVESTTSENDDELRADGVSFLIGLAAYMDHSVLMSTVLPLFLRLASDPSFHVRRACASHYSDMCKLVGAEASEMLMFEKFSNLCEDNVWGVRKACIMSFPGVADALGPTLRATQLTESYLKLLGDQSRWVRLMAYQVLGEFIATFRLDKPKVMSPFADDRESDDRETSCNDVDTRRINCNSLADGESESHALIENNSLLDSSKDNSNVNSSGTVAANASQACKINLSFRSDSDGDDQVPDAVSCDDGLTIHDDLPINSASERDKDIEVNGNIFVNDFNEFVAKMFGDVNKDEDGPTSVENTQNIEDCVSFSCPSFDDNVDATLNLKGVIMENSSNLNFIEKTSISTDLNFERTCFENQNNDVIDSFNSKKNDLISNLEYSNKSEGERSEGVSGCGRDAKDGVRSGNKKFLLRSAPVLLLFDAASVEESEAPVFETALNFGTTHHRVRSKQTTVRFGEEESSNEEVGRLKDRDYDDEDDLVLDEDSGKLETADDFTKTSLSLPEEAVASRPLSPVTCRTLKAGGGRWCRQTMVYVASKEGYGKMPPINSGAGKVKKSCEFKQCPVPGKLLDTFLEMSDSYLSELFDSEIQLHCAYCFPAVTLTLGRINWPILKDFYMTLVTSTQVKVRRTLSHSVHEMAVILGDDIIESDLLAVFDDFCCDLDEVKMGVVEHLYDFIKLLPTAGKLKYIDKLPGMTAEDNGRNWRMRDVLIRELEKILDLLTLEEMHKHLMHLVFTLMSDQVAVVRHSSIKLIGKILFLLCKDSHMKPRAPDEEKPGALLKPENQISPEIAEEVCAIHSPNITSACNQDDDSYILNQILDDLVQRFANSCNFRQRQSFILVCHHLLNIPSFPALAKIFSPNLLLNPFLQLHSDAIVNVRITLCRILYCDFPKIASLEYVRKNPTDLLDPINKLWNDSDPDVHRLAEKFLSLVVH